MKNFLAPPSADHLKALQAALAAIAKTSPVPASHRKDQPYAIRDLSRLLTIERTDMKVRSYWSSPRMLSAYVHYFLPWNLYRLAWLLPGLELNLKKDDLLVDLGSGPLTVILALFCFRPELRSLPLNIVCLDTAKQPMETGRAILQALAGKDLPWRISLLRGPVHSALKSLRGKANLITAGNVLNELQGKRHQSMEESMDGLVAIMRAKMAEDSRLLLLEPGTRLGGKLVSLARKSALRAGFDLLGPCPHQGPCPMLEQWRYNPKGPDTSGWCHFMFPADKAPQSLTELTGRARLDKDSLSLSVIYARRLQGQDAELEDDAWPDFDPDLDLDLDDQGFEHETADAGHQAALREERRKARPFEPENPGPQARLRVISEGIRLPDEVETARYVCSARGLGLLKNAGRVPSGGGVSVPWPKKTARDHKSGALIFEYT